MKMTRLEWRYLQGIALDHPYYDTHKPPLSDAEARAIVQANNTMTGREFVDSVYAKLGMVRPVKEKERLAWLRSIGGLFSVPSIRRIAIAVLAVVLLTVFFAATPVGRAIAESVIQYIATLFDDGRLVMTQTGRETPLLLIDKEKETGDAEEQKNENGLINVSSFEDFTNATGRIPVILPLPCTELYYEYDETIDYSVLYAIYETPRGKIASYQIWNVEDLASSTSEGFTVYDTQESIYYSMMENGRISCQKSLEDSIITILSDGDYTLEDIIGLLKKAK